MLSDVRGGTVHPQAVLIVAVTATAHNPFYIQLVVTDGR